MDLDPYGRPPSRTSGEAAFLRDNAQARSGNTLSYGGRRFVGEVRRGGLLGSPAVLYGIPVRCVPAAHATRRAATGLGVRSLAARNDTRRDQPWMQAVATRVRRPSARALCGCAARAAPLRLRISRHGRIQRTALRQRIARARPPRPGEHG